MTPRCLYILVCNWKALAESKLLLRLWQMAMSIWHHWSWIKLYFYLSGGMYMYFALLRYQLELTLEIFLQSYENFEAFVL